MMGSGRGEWMSGILEMGAVGLMAFAWTAVAMAGGPPKDGELALPDYKGWPKFLSAVQRPDVKQVREIYINPTGAKAIHGQPFPDGTQFVMELYQAQADGDKLMVGADGKLVKGNLIKVFVMGKDKGWGEGVPDHLKNGTWVYAAYGPNGQALNEDFTKCRACHAPLAQKDFVHRYEEYFEERHHGK